VNIVRVIIFYIAPEYWIVEPDGKYINVFTLQENKRYGRPEAFTEEEKVQLSVFPDLTIDLKPVFDGISKYLDK